MKVKHAQVSALEKICVEDTHWTKSICRATVLKGEKYSYQIAVFVQGNVEFRLDVNSVFENNLKLYIVQNAIMDMPAYDTSEKDLINIRPGIMPDILMPAEFENNMLRLNNSAGAIWVEIDVPESIEAGEYLVKIVLSSCNKAENESLKIVQNMMLDVIDVHLPKYTTKFTQWLHVDCIADIHNVAVYSEEHWSLIDKYMHLANELGINMILTPIITPPLDTEEGAYRQSTQLVKIRKEGGKYYFDFTLLKRWIEMCRKNCIEYYEMSHLFSQWGLKYSPNIVVEENGEELKMFGWHIDAHSAEYRSFLIQFLPALIEFLKSEGIKEKCFFHLSDEPRLEHLDAYRYAHDLVIPLIEDCPVMDAISDIEFYDSGLIKNPVTALSYVNDFLSKNIQNQWLYNCCVDYKDVGNRFLSMPSYRNRILGIQMYKYNIEGFLHWGYNFYYNQISRKKINPYITTSADRAFPSGDPFSVYPIEGGVVPSLRAIVFRDALTDIEVLRVLESYIGREKVIEMIDESAGMDLSFTQYPKDDLYIIDLIEKVKQEIKKYSRKGNSYGK